MRIILADEAATIRLGSILAQQLHAGCVVFLEGELGAGKTTLVRGFLQALGHRGKVKSPTYTLVEPYLLSTNSPAKRVYHFDLYRMQEPEELEYMGARDYFTDDAICFVEWPQKGEGWLPEADFTIKLSQHEDGRALTITATSVVGKELVQFLEKSIDSQ